MNNPRRVCHKFMSHPLFNLFIIFSSSDYTELSEEHSCCTDYARNLNGKRPMRSRRLKLYVKVTQISQMTQIQTCSVYGMTQILTCSVYGMTQIFFLHRITRSYRKENLRNLRNLRDYTSCSSGYSTAQVAFRLNSVRNP